MYLDNKSSYAFLYSKHQKWLGKISNYWKEQAAYYNERLDEGANMDSQDKYDHGGLANRPQCYGI